MANHLFDAFAARAAAVGLDRVALEAQEGDYSFGRLLDLSGQFANALRRSRVKPGDRVAAQAEKSVAMVALAIACFRSGAVLLPLNPAYTLNELEYFLGDARPALTLCAPKALSEVAALAGRLGLGAASSLGAAGDGAFEAAAAAESARFADAACGADDLAAILYTSGTTGRSKGAMLTHGNLLSNAVTLVDRWRFTREDVLIHALPIFHTHGLFVATHVALLSGAKMIFQARFDADAAIAAIPRATSLMGVPTFYVRLLDQPGLDRALCAKMRLFVSGSAPLLADTHRQWFERTGHRILERYGMTETNMIASNPYDGERRAGTVGFALPGVSVRIADPVGGQALPRGEIGVIEVKGPNVFTGYWNMPEKTAAEFRADGFFVTGDLAKEQTDGYIEIVGRAKDLVISGGFNVYPKEIESEIDAIPGVVESAVVGLPHKDFGEGVTAFVTLEPDAALDEAAILAKLAGRLAKFKRPKRVITLAQLPRNAMGKVQKAALRAEHAALYGEADA